MCLCFSVFAQISPRVYVCVSVLIFQQAGVSLVITKQQLLFGLSCGSDVFVIALKTPH